MNAFESLAKLPYSLRYTICTGNKSPIPDNWYQQPIELNDALNRLGTVSNDKKVEAIGLLLGEVSGGILALDHDGSSATAKIEELSGLTIDEAIPPTVSFTSGKLGRFQSLYFVPETYWPYCHITIFKTGVKDDSGKPEQVEFRWGSDDSAHQSIIYGAHPDTGNYRWIDGYSPPEVAIAQCPKWILRQIVRFDRYLPAKREDWHDRDYALSYLSALPPAEDYDIWLSAGMALKSVDEGFLEVWESWSSLANNYKPGECNKKWGSFKRDGVGLGTLGQLAKQHGWKGKQPEAHAEQVDSEEQEAIATEVKELLGWSEQQFPIHTLLHRNIADPIARISKALNVPESAYIHVLLPIGASLLKAQTSLEVSVETDHYARPIIWSGLVAPSGAVKSPIFHHLQKPLVDYENSLFEDHKEQHAQWERDLEKWNQQDKNERGDKPEEPKPRDLYFQDATIEAIAADIANYPDHGSLVAVDELAGFFRGLNQYKSRGGNDQQRWLSCYDGRSLKISRKTSKGVRINHTSLSMVGTIQPEILQKLMGNLREVDGLWQRYLWVNLPLTIMPPPGDGPRFDLSGLLQGLYQYLDRLPVQTFNLSSDARKVWREWHIWIERHRCQEDHPTLRAMYPKAREQAARIALVAHCINSYFIDDLSETVSQETVEAAIAYTKFCIEQARLIYADFGVCENPESVRISKFVTRFKGTDWVDAKKTRSWWSANKKPSADECRTFLAKLVTLGYARDNGQTGRKYAIKISIDSPQRAVAATEKVTKVDYKVTKKVTNFLNPEESIEQVFQPFVTETTKVTKENQGQHPRDAVTIAKGRVEVDLDRLSLDYEPAIAIPSWEPKKVLKDYSGVHKLYLDIETTGLDPENDRVIMVGLLPDGYLELGDASLLTDSVEAKLLQKLWEFIGKLKPEALIGHNLFAFDLPFLAQRSELLGVQHPLKCADKPMRISASSFNGKPIEFTPWYINGCDILDTFQQVAIWDRQAAKLTGYGLKDSVIALNLRTDRRLELSVHEIREYWETGDLDHIGEYLKFDLEDTKLLADYLIPVVWYQQKFVPKMTFQRLAVASPAAKAQVIHEALLSGVRAQADEKLDYDGAHTAVVNPGLHKNVCKLDVSSLYPSIMLRYGLCSRKDPDQKFLGVLEFMRAERLRLKELAKQGNVQAEHEQDALKRLINGSYGFLGTGGYSFNDYEAAALVTAYGRKILAVMAEAIASTGATLIELDTDGILFSSEAPEIALACVQAALPTGINVELELSGCGAFVPKIKNYVIVKPNGKTTVKGLFRKRNKPALEKSFPEEFLKTYFLQSPEVAQSYYQEVRRELETGSYPVEDLTITRKISAKEQHLVDCGLGKPGDRVSFYYGPGQIVTTAGHYDRSYYLEVIDRLYQEITGLRSDGQLELSAVA